MLTTKKVADRLGVTDARVRQLAIAGTLRGEKAGRDWLFEEAEVERYAASRCQTTGAHYVGKKSVRPTA